MTMPTIRTLSRDGTLKRTDTGLFCRLEDIHELPGFNIIRDYNSPKYQQSVDELVAYLEAGGTVEALEVRPRAEGGVWVVQGHTRRFANELGCAPEQIVKRVHANQRIDAGNVPGAMRVYKVAAQFLYVVVARLTLGGLTADD